MSTTTIRNTLKAETLRRVNQVLVIEQARLSGVMVTKASDDLLFKAYGQLEGAIDLICEYLNTGE